MANNVSYMASYFEQADVDKLELQAFDSFCKTSKIRACFEPKCMLSTFDFYATKYGRHDYGLSPYATQVQRCARDLPEWKDEIHRIGDHFESTMDFYDLVLASAANNG